MVKSGPETWCLRWSDLTKAVCRGQVRPPRAQRQGTLFYHTELEGSYQLFYYTENRPKVNMQV